MDYAAIDGFVSEVDAARKAVRRAPVPSEELARAIIERVEAMCCKPGPHVGYLSGNLEAPLCKLPRGHADRCVLVAWRPWREAYCAANAVITPSLDALRERLGLTEEQAAEALRVYAAALGGTGAAA